MQETLRAGDRGRAVRELNENLRILGYEAGTGDRFTQPGACLPCRRIGVSNPPGRVTAVPGAC